MRVITANLSGKQSIDLIRGVGAKTPNIVSYKALSRLNGNTRRKVVHTEFGGMEFKANIGRQALSTIGSIITPGDMGPLRSPVRSTVYRTITPGLGGRRGGSLPGQNRAHRCPEGYQYGGRFTDNRFSTCGAQLFDIPSALGATIAAARRAQTSGLAAEPTGRVLTGVAAPSNIIQSRRPQIPRVGNENKQVRASRVKSEVSQIGKYLKTKKDPVRRMVRRDGFVLEPVVPNKVLRAIPDNRDMEGAYFVMGTFGSSQIGGEELGLLSNTGIKSLIYTLPGGSTLTLEKARPLTVGERRKLGRLVNTAQKVNNKNDPSARLRTVSRELEGGIVYRENFIGIKNPNEIINGRPRWARELLSGKVSGAKDSTVRETASFEAKKKKISSIGAAIDHIVEGGSLANIDPKIMSAVLAKSGVIRKERMSAGISTIQDPAGKYFLYERPKEFQHLAERFASDLQQHLGLESPDVIFAGPPGNKRRYLRQDVEMAVSGGKFDPSVKFNDLDPADVARMMIADFLTDQRERPNSSIYPIIAGDDVRAVLAQNTTSGLIDLSKIQITKRMQMRINDFYESALVPSYSDYYQALKAEQRILFIRLINQMINKARSFSPNRFKDNMGEYGMSAGEKIHLNIIGKLFDERLAQLSAQKDVLRQIVRGGK